MSLDLERFGDADVWWELEVSDSRGKRIVIGDYNSREEAEAAQVPPWARTPRVLRRHGLDPSRRVG